MEAIINEDLQGQQAFLLALLVLDIFSLHELHFKFKSSKLLVDFTDYCLKKSFSSFQNFGKLHCILFVLLRLL